MAGRDASRYQNVGTGGTARFSISDGQTDIIFDYGHIGDIP